MPTLQAELTQLINDSSYEYWLILKEIYGVDAFEGVPTDTFKSFIKDIVTEGMEVLYSRAVQSKEARQ